MLRKVSNITKGLISAYIVQTELTEPQIVRLFKCKTCPFLRFRDILGKQHAQCGSCGCWIEAKVRVNDEQCPEGEWSKITK